jgi:hypothetical protein
LVKHIVVWRLKGEGLEKARAAQWAKTLLEGLAGKIPGLIRIEVGVNFLDDANAADLVLYSEFSGRVALAQYQIHPEHVAVAAQVRELAAERRVVDYDC